MSLPQLLLVDDSEAIITFEKAALAGHYAFTVATNGVDALARVAESRPDMILLDLSMPQMDGDEVLTHLQANPDTRSIPVIIISSEKARAEKCLIQGAAAFLHKPLRADKLVAMVAKILEDTRLRERQGNLSVLFVEVGNLRLGVSLEGVRGVVDHPLTTPLPAAPSYLCEYFDYHGAPTLVLCLARRLGVQHLQPLLDRKLVVIEREQQSLALCVDRVQHPEEVPRANVIYRDQLGGTEHGTLKDVLKAMVRTPERTIPVVDVGALLSRGMLHERSGKLKGAEALSAAARVER